MSRPPETLSRRRCAIVVARRLVPQKRSYAREPTYGTIYVMHRTTVYLPEEMKARLTAEAERRGLSEAEIIRRAVDKELTRRLTGAGIITEAPPEGVSGRNLHEHMEGFGED
jgi:predicted transcriptional regulator